MDERVNAGEIGCVGGRIDSIRFVVCGTTRRGQTGPSERASIRALCGAWHKAADARCERCGERKQQRKETNDAREATSRVGSEEEISTAASRILHHAATLGVGRRELVLLKRKMSS